MSRDSLKALRKAAGAKNISTDQATCGLYGSDATQLEALPLAVVHAADTRQVARIMACCFDYGLAVVPRGAGSGFTGGAVPVAGGVVLNLSGMTNIEVMPEHRLLHAEPGALIDEIKKAATSHNLFFPPDPSSAAFATIGGSVAENAGGLRAIKYGVISDYVLALEAVLMDGRIIKTGSQTNKSVVGYDLTRLLIGSEGTLAVITGITLKLITPPEALSTLSACFTSETQALDVVNHINRQPIVPTALEFLDRRSLAAVKSLGKLELPQAAKAFLLVEVDGAFEVVKRQAEQLSSMLLKGGGFNLQSAHSADDALEIWKVRRGISQGMHQLGTHKLNQDIALPLGNMSAFMEIMDKAANDFEVPIAVFGHVGDGNLHVNIMYNGNDPTEARQAQDAVNFVFAHTLHLQGSVSGEHGVGIKKLAGARLELDENALDMMWRIKRAFDPSNLLNPGKALPRI